MVFAGGWAFPAEFIPEFERGAKDTVATALALAAGLQPDVDREGRTSNGPAARVLLDQAEDADLLVVGSRGLGGFAGMLLGSVSQQVAHHARCPVVIVHKDASA